MNDALQRKRLSERLRIEKELFPKCIQAPMKYENKRKSSLNINENRHSTFFNHSYLPGEEVSALTDMANTTKYVQQWLSSNEPNLARKPFSDLNVNTSWELKPKRKTTKQTVGEKILLAANRKRASVENVDKSYSRKGGKSNLVYKYDNTIKKVKKESPHYVKNIKSNIQEKSNNDESGIFMENEPIVICDSQETVVDKDKNAWLAVLKASENEIIECDSLSNLSHVSCTNDDNTHLTHSIATEAKVPSFVKVPFFKRSAIIETCKNCKNEVSSQKRVLQKEQEKPVKITIDGDNFLTTISVFKNVQNNLMINTMNTVSIQTNICETASNGIPDNLMLSKSVKTFDGDIHIEDVIVKGKETIKHYISQSTEVSKCVVIQESDSDTDLDASGPMSIRAEVHKSCEELDYGILNEVLNVKDHENKLLHRPRGYTPTSTDSSEKENYHPNRIKRRIAGKKKKTKK